MQALNWTALVLVIVGGLNWGLVGAFEFNLVDSIFGEMSMLSRLTYSLVGLSAVYLLFIAPKLMEPKSMVSKIASQV